MPPPVAVECDAPAFVVLEGDVADDGALGLVDDCCANAAPAIPTPAVSASASSNGLR
jgi:hypothetical protein